MSFLVSAHRVHSFRLALHRVHLFRTGLAVSTLLLGFRAHAVQPKTPFRVGAPQPKGWLGERGFDPTSVTLSQTPARGELFFIDGAVADPKAFWLTAPVGATVVCIPADVEAWDYMAETATAFRNLRAIHIISHGQPGAVTLNVRRYTAQDLTSRSAALRMLGGALSKNGDILLYGCETADGNDGVQLVTTLAELTGADVAGSLNPTGSRPGADWNLEISCGDIEAPPLAPKDYEHVLADFSVSNLSDLRTALTTAASNNEADTITITGNITAVGSGDMLSGPDGQPTFVVVNPTDGKTLTIVGGGNTLDAGHYGRALYVQAGTVDISNLTITKGLLSGNGGLGNSNLSSMTGQSVRGAGLYNAGILQLNGVAITANKAAGGGGAGNGYKYGGGGGGGGGFGGIGGGTGGSTYSGAYAGIAGGGGVGGRGGSEDGVTVCGFGGSSTGGAGGSAIGYINGGAGATASNGSISIGGGGGGTGEGGVGSPGSSPGGPGGAAAGGIFNSGTLTIIGSSSISNNLGAGGGGGGAALKSNGGDGGRGIGGAWNTGTLKITAANVAAMTGNAGVGGTGGSKHDTGVAGTKPAAQDNIYNEGSLDLAYVVPAPPVVTDVGISISGGSGTGGAFKIGDTVTATWNNTAGGDNNSGITGVTVDFSAFGGGSAVAATNSSGTWTATYTIVAGAIDATNLNVSVTATNAVGDTTTADTTHATVDSVAPAVSEANISISGASGTGGAFKIGDTVTATWDNTASGDNNSDTISGVTVNFSQFGGGAAVAATNSSGTWTATYTIIAGAINATNRNVSVTATDNAGNTTTTADTTNATVENVAPQVTSIVRQTPSAQVVQTGPVIFEVTFSESVTGVGTHSFAVIPVNGGTTTGSVVSVTGGPKVYEVTVDLTGGTGDFRLDVGVMVTTFATGFSNSGALAFDQAGNLYVADHNNWVRRVTAGGVVSTFASGFNLPHGVAFSPAGDLYVSNSNEVKKVTPGGVVSTFATGFSAAAGLAFDSAGNLYVGNFGNKTVSKVTDGGVVSTFATNIDAPFGLAFDAAGNLFVSSRDTNVISKITPGGVVTGFVTDLNQPYQLQFDTAGDLFVAERSAKRILRVKPDGTVSIYADNLPDSTGLAFDATGALYVSSHYGDNTVRKVSSSVSDLAGNAAGALTYSSGEIYTYDPNDAPTATNLTQSVSYTEDNGAVALADIVVSDADASDTITATLTLSAQSGGALSTGIYGSATSSYNAGTGVWTVTGSLTDVNAALAAVAFTPAANYNATLTIATQIRDAANTGPANGSITLTGTPINDTPVITNLNGDVRAYSEGDAFISIDTGAMAAIADIELDVLDNYSGATITVVRNGGATADDDFGFFAGSGVSLSGGNILKSGSSIATFVVTGGQLVITFTDVNGQTPTTFNANYIVRNIGYRNTSDNPPGSVTLNVTAFDGELTSTVVAVTVNITATNDAPTGISLSSSSVNQSQGANAVVGGFSTADVDDSSFTYALVSGADSTHNALFNVSGADLRANDAAAMAAGSYSIRIRTTDSASGAFEASFSVTVVDDVAPAAPSMPDLVAGSDTGSSSSDNITSDTTPTFTGTAEANSTVELFQAGANSLGTALANGSGAWSITVATPLTAGTHSITATAKDGANNTSAASGALSITIDDTAPSAPSTPNLADTSDTGTSDTDDVTNDTTPTFTGTAEANSSVELFQDVTTSLGIASVDSGGAWTLTVGTAMTAGNFSITAIATDAAGIPSGASNALSITIDTTAPTTPVISAISEDLGTSATDFITSDTTLIISGTAEVDSFVTVFRNAVDIGMVQADADGIWSFDFTGSALAEGTHTFTATAADVAGNISSASPDLLVEIVIATITAPVITAISNDSGANSTDGVTNDATLVFTGTATANQTITVARNGVGEIGTTTANGAGPWSFDYSATTLPEGVHLFNAIASDLAGNASAVSADFAVTIDTTAPAIGMQPAGGTFVAGGSFDLSVSATDGSALTYQWNLGGTTLNDSSNRSGATSATVSHINIGTAGFAGDYTVVVTDLAGNSTTSAIATIAVEKAEQTISFAPIADQLSTSAPFAISATASTGFAVTFSIVSGPATINGSIVTVTGVGTVTIRATQEGDLNYSATVAEQTFAVTSPPLQTSAPVITQQPANQAVNAGGTANFSVSATGTPSPSYQWRRGGAVLTGETAALLSVSNVRPSDSGATFDVIVTNTAGSVTSNSATLSVSAVAGTEQIFFGPMGADGHFGFYVRENREAVFIGHLPAGGGSHVLKFTLDANGAFQAGTSGSTAQSGAASSAKGARRLSVAMMSLPLISGSVVNGQLYFQVDGGGEVFGGVAQSTGSTSALAGFYEAPFLNESRGMTYLIVGADGTMVSATFNGSTTEVTQGSVSPAGQFVLQMDSVTVLEGSLGADGRLTGRVAVNGIVTANVSGVSVGVTHTDRLVNISTRGATGDNDKLIMAGFVISGSAPKEVLIRAVGPGLTAFGVTGAMQNPVLTLFHGSQIIHTNDDWSSSTNASFVVSEATRLGASALASASKDAALRVSLDPGIYTAHITRAPGTTNGVALIELYDASLDAGAETQKLVNISSRGEVGTGENILISGFVVTGNYPKKMLIRGVGPSLARQGLGGVLANPVLRIWKGNTEIASNDDWSSDNAVAIDAAAMQVGAFPLDNPSKDAAILLTLAPGVYTAQVSGSNGTTGIALVEVYDVP